MASSNGHVSIALTDGVIGAGGNGRMHVALKDTSPSINTVLSNGDAETKKVSFSRRHKTPPNTCAADVWCHCGASVHMRLVQDHGIAFSATSPITMTWERISASVIVPDMSSSRRTQWWRLCGPPATRVREVLHDLHGCVTPGQMVAVLGPSGSGKTTLLSVLGRRSTSTTIVRGTVRVDNARGVSKDIGRRIGFVTQDDTMWASLSVRQTLLYTARLRLPSSLSREALVERVDAVIQLLGLTHCQHTQIGGPLKRGLSGGERKRTSIGIELLTTPSLVMADEATSGLDATIALRLLLTLRDWSTASGCGFLMSIHQPASRLFRIFDECYVLADGHLVYSGSPSNVQPYFARIGFLQPADTNPADWLLDLASGDSSVGGPDAQRAITAAHQHAHPSPKAQPDDDDAHPYDGAQARDGSGLPKWPVSWWTQVTVLAQRNISARAEGVFDTWRVAQVILVALMSGLLWLNSGRERPLTLARVDDIAGLVFFLVVFNAFLSLFAALFTFPAERAITIKERRSGWYRLSAYYVGRTVADLPLDLALPSAFIGIAFWMVGLRAAIFVQFWLLNLLAVLVSTSLGLLISAACTEQKQAQTLASVLVLVLMLAGSFYLQHIPAWLSWLKYISYLNHAFSAGLKLQFPKEATAACVGAAGRQCLVRTSVRLSSLDWHLPAAYNVGCLFAELVVLRVATYWVLQWRLR